MMSCTILTFENSEKAHFKKIEDKVFGATFEKKKKNGFRSICDKGGIFFAPCCKTNLPKLKLFQLMIQNCLFRILFQFHHSVCVETCIHPSHTAHKNCRDLYPPFSYRTQKMSAIPS